VHGQIGQSYTDYNQIIGVGLGFSANKQIVMRAWVSGNNKLGIFIEKLIEILKTILFFGSL
jgi:hypothetical protein